MSLCKVYLENYGGNYYAGSEIRGRVECFLDDNTKIRGVHIRIICREYNSWTGTESYTDPADNKSKTRFVTLEGNNNFIFLEQTLFGSGSGSTVLQRGKHVYPFSCQLPYDIPSSFIGPHGTITYKLVATVDRPMRTDYVNEFMFLVTSVIDFNRMPQHLQDVSTYSDDKTVCCWCCQGGNVSMEVELPKIAFVPGETIPFKVRLTNLSNSNVDILKVNFVKTLTYKVTRPHYETKTDVDNIVFLTEHGVGAHGEHTYNLELAIPSCLEVQNFIKCSLFSVAYNLKVSAKMPSCTLDLDVNVWDIQMGHIQYASQMPSGVVSPVGIQVPPFVDVTYPLSSGIHPPAAPYNFPYPPSAPGYPTTPNDKPVDAGGIASAPTAPFDPKAAEAAGTTSTSASMNAPPSYDEVQQNIGFVYPKRQ